MNVSPGVSSPEASTPAPVVDRRAELLALVRAQPSPVRRDVERRDVGSLVAAGVLMGVLFLVVGGPHATARPLWLVLGAAVAWAVVAGGATTLAVRRGPSLLGTPRSWLLGVALAVPLLLGASWFLLPSPLVARVVPHAYRIDGQCFAVTIALAVAPLVAFVLRRPEGDPIRPAVTGAALGAAAGCWAAVLMDLHCEMTDPRHVVLGHLLPVMVLTGVGALVAQAALAVRSRGPRPR